MKYVIIGNSAAAVGCVEGIRSLDSEGEIVMVSDEPHHTYSRPLISYLLQGRTDRQRMKYRPDDFYGKNGAALLSSRRAERIDPLGKTVLLDNGESLSYDKLLVAAGSSPFVPPMKGLETVEKRFCFMSLDQAEALERALFPQARVLIVGAGLIGLKCAEGIAARVGGITVADLAPRVLSRILDEDGAKLVKSRLEDGGMRLLLGVSVEEFKGDRAIMTNGETVEFDILVTAVGVRPNVSLVKDAGGLVRRGIAVDGEMRTSLPDVYAAGDCVESFDLSSGQERVLAILPNAYAGGFAAGMSMAGGRPPEQKAIPMNAIGFFGLHIITAGSYTGQVFEASDSEGCKKLFYSDDRLNGFILVGNVDKAGIYTALVRERTPLSSIDFELVCRQPSLIAFSRAYRDEKLEGKAHEN